MRRVIFAALVFFMLPACEAGNGWAPSPGAPLIVGDLVTAAVPAPDGCEAVQVSPVTWQGKPVFDVTALPTETTVTLKPSGLVMTGDRTVDRSCVTPYTLQK
jgi:hypothetical protein